MVTRQQAILGDFYRSLGWHKIVLTSVIGAKTRANPCGTVSDLKIAFNSPLGKGKKGPKNFPCIYTTITACNSNRRQTPVIY